MRRGSDGSASAGTCLRATLALLLIGSGLPAWESAVDEREPTPRHLESARLQRSDPHAAALHEARACQQRAFTLAHEALDRLIAWDPEAMRTTWADDWLKLLALDHGGHLRQAQEQAQRAAALARTLSQEFRALKLQAILACQQDHHGSELEHSRRLMVLDPGSDCSLLWLRRAARCNGLRRLELEMDRKLAAMRRQALQ